MYKKIGRWIHEWASQGSEGITTTNGTNGIRRADGIRKEKTEQQYKKTHQKASLGSEGITTTNGTNEHEWDPRGSEGMVTTNGTNGIRGADGIRKEKTEQQ